GDQPGADGVAVGPAPAELDDQPVAAAGRLVPEDDARGLVVDDDQVQVAVVVEVAAGEASAHVKGPEVVARAGGDVREPAGAGVAPEDRWVLVGIQQGPLAADVAIGGDQVEPAIEV